MTTDAPDEIIRRTQRIDKWLWHARFFKTRTLAAKLCGAGKIRVNRGRITKRSFTVKTGDVLTFPQARTIRVVRIIAIGDRRGPASEARALYDDLSPEPSPMASPTDSVTSVQATRDRGTGRPTKAARRAIDALLGWRRR